MVDSFQMELLEKEILGSGMPLAALMEKVGQGMARCILQKPTLLNQGVLVLVGPGHNGGDGLVVARELHLAGVKVEIWIPLKISKVLTSKHLEHLQWLGVKNINEVPKPKENNLWIDAIFGVAQRRPLPKDLVDLLIARQKFQPGRLISLDIPSGVCSNTGKSLSHGVAVSSETITAGFIKQGLVQDAALSNVGKITRVDIGIPQYLLNASVKSQLRVLLPGDLENFTWPYIPPNAMKYRRGRVLIIAGSKEYLGAAFLTLIGALASGAGSIKASLPKCVSEGLWHKTPEVVFLDCLNSSEDERNCLRSLLEKEDISKFDAILIGPGLGSKDKEWDFSAEVLSRFSGLLVLDADGLNRVAFSDSSWHWFKQRQGPTWITPHFHEFLRLFPEMIDLEPLSAALKAANSSGVSILLKGAHTVVADPVGHAWQVIETLPLAARCGLGDLLAGYATGIGSIGILSEDGLSTEMLAFAALAHSEAARRCTKSTSASAIAEVLAQMTRDLQLRNVP